MILELLLVLVFIIILIVGYIIYILIKYMEDNPYCENAYNFSEEAKKELNDANVLEGEA